MRKTLTYAILLAVLLIPTLSLGTPGILKMFIARYPASEGSQLSNCRTCHMPAQKNCLNSYALDLKENGLDFGSIEKADSDGDTVSNIAEISAKQLPGSQAQADEVFLFMSVSAPLPSTMKNTPWQLLTCLRVSATTATVKRPFPGNLMTLSPGRKLLILYVRDVIRSREVRTHRKPVFFVMTSRIRNNRKWVRKFCNYHDREAMIDSIADMV